MKNILYILFLLPFAVSSQSNDSTMISNQEVIKIASTIAAQQDTIVKYKNATMELLYQNSILDSLNLINVEIMKTKNLQLEEMKKAVDSIAPKAVWYKSKWIAFIGGVVVGVLIKSI